MSGTEAMFARAPLRLGLAGGGSDVDPFCSEYGGRILNSTIAKYVYASITSVSGSSRVASVDRGASVQRLSGSEVRNSAIPLHQATLEFFIDNFLSGKDPGVLLETYTDVPIGSGLGTSSSLVVVMVGLLSDFFSLGMGREKIANLAFHIEREICGFAGGRQDFFSAVYGGFNFIEFGRGTSVVHTLRVPSNIFLSLEKELLLVNLGKSRLSSEIIEAQISGLMGSDYERRIETMVQIRDEANLMKNQLLSGDILGMASSVNKGWELKKTTASTVTTPEIEEFMNIAAHFGSYGGKVSGAGGGGHAFLFVDQPKRRDLISELTRRGWTTENVHFVKEGLQTWRAGN